MVYLRSKKIRLEDKIINVVFLAFFIFASNFNALDFILHGFRFPNMLPGRYTFLICFVLLLVGYRGFLLLKDLSTSDIFGMAVLSITMLGLSCFSLGENKVLGNIILVAAYLLFFFLYERRLLRKTAFAVFICLMITAEMISSLVLSMDTVGKTSYTNYPYRQEEITDLNEALEDLDPTFWRTEMTCRYYLNDGVMYSYRGIGQFSSTANRGVRDLMSHLAFTTGANSYYYNFSSPLNNALLGLKYLTSRSGELISGTFVEPYFEANNLKVYENTAYIGWNVFEDYANIGSLHLKELVLYAVSRLLPACERKVNVQKMPDRGVVTVTRQKDREIVHLLFAHTTVRGKKVEIIEDAVELANVKVSLAADKAPEKVYLAPSGEEIPFAYADGRVEITVPSVILHQMVVVE